MLCVSLFCYILIINCLIRIFFSTTNSVLILPQPGFWSKHSTVSALTLIVNDTVNAVSKNIELPSLWTSQRNLMLLTIPCVYIFLNDVGLTLVLGSRIICLISSELGTSLFRVFTNN